jgi:predicted nucleotidyltransferase
MEYYVGVPDLGGKSMTDLEKSILATLVYYDVLGRPLTGWEVFRYLIRYQKPIKLEKILDVLESNPRIGQKNGFYFLKGRAGLVKQRIEKQKLADQRWKKISRMVKLLQNIPYIRMIMVSGSLAMNNPKKESDIDLLIATRAGRIWTCRGITTLFIHLLGQRRHGQLTENRFCLNHYITDQSLKIPLDSLYNAQTYAHLIPVWQAEAGLYKKFQQANQWLTKYLAFYPSSRKSCLRKVRNNRLFNSTRGLREFVLDTQMGDALEFILKKIQARRIRKDPLTYRASGRVVFDDSQLEFHPDSPEKKILERYNQRMKELDLAEMAQEKDSGLRA